MRVKSVEREEDELEGRKTRARPVEYRRHKKAALAGVCIIFVPDLLYGTSMPYDELQ